MEKRFIAGLLQDQDVVIEEQRALHASAGSLSHLLEGCLAMDEAMEVDVDKEKNLVAKALEFMEQQKKQSKQNKKQAEDAEAWEHDIACWNDLMMSLVIIRSAGDEKDEEVKKIQHDLNILEKRLKNKASVKGYKQWVESRDS